MPSFVTATWRFSEFNRMIIDLTSFLELTRRLFPDFSPLESVLRQIFFKMHLSLLQFDVNFFLEVEGTVFPG